MKVSPMPETLVMEEEHCEQTENSTSLAAAPVEKEVAVQETLMEVDTVKEEVVAEVIVKEKEEAVAQTTVGDNETGAEAQKGNKQQGRGPRNNRQGGKRTWEKERKKEKKVEEKRVAAADKSEEAPKTTTSLTELPKKSYSSAMKSNLVEKADSNSSSSAASPKSNSSSSHKEERSLQKVPAVKETPAVRESEEVWETVPPSVAAGEPESWEKTPQSKKRKHKKSAREAVVRFEAKEEEEQIHSSAAPALVKEAEPVVVKNEVKEAREVVVEVEEVKEEIE